MNNEYIIQNTKRNISEYRLAVIDGDSIAWTIGWHYKDDPTNKEAIEKAVDDYVLDIFYGTQCARFIGVLAPIAHLNIPNLNIPNFRENIAHKDRPYKGNRPPKPEWYIQIAPIIENRLVLYWGFVDTPAGYEADDLVASLMSYFDDKETKAVCCGTDKDLLQIPGEHYNIKKKTFQYIPYAEAHFNLWKQVLMGDNTDGIPGIPSIGKVKANKILNSSHYLQTLKLSITAFETYLSYFDEDTAIERFYETYMLVKLKEELITKGISGAYLGVQYLDIDKVNAYINGIKEAQELGQFEENHEDLMYFKEDVGEGTEE